MFSIMETTVRSINTIIEKLVKAICGDDKSEELKKEWNDMMPEDEDISKQFSELLKQSYDYDSPNFWTKKESFKKSIVQKAVKLKKSLDDAENKLNNFGSLTEYFSKSNVGELLDDLDIFIDNLRNIKDYAISTFARLGKSEK